ncbi:hypothetical protein [Pedobacter sp. JY14-1]|uniref:hypothetical protein n=1 Tax=Pedobacter sp. JY14-1 TaxID=3034151 RepID=UPI0023E1B863|nr:hypothetical protein [Pedobacter sp. JY14-1]
MKPVTIWAANSEAELSGLAPSAVLKFNKMHLEAFLTSDSLWLIHTWPDGCRTGFRTAFSPSGNLELKAREETDMGTQFELECATLKFTVTIQFPDSGNSVFRYQTILTPKIPVYITYWPKDILPFGADSKIKQDGEIHTNQVGTRSGLLFFNDGQSGSVFYFQNLTALNDYCQETETSAGELVGGSWPEIGFNLPQAGKPLQKGTHYQVSDAFVRLLDETPSEKTAVCGRFLDHLADTYLLLPKPERHYHNWLDTVEKGIQDLTYHKGCWTYGGGHTYLNAYVADYKSPPEIMVQLAVLLPMVEYLEWKGEKNHQLVAEIKAGIEQFYQPDMRTVVRWLPALEKNLDHSEEQKKPRVMDAWYLHHPIMNLARLAERGDKTALKLFNDAIGYVMRVARHFDYQWPVFYQMDTLKVIKAETSPGQGGEKDVPGTYADLMLRAWKLTGDDKYFREAVKAAKKLEGLGFELFYQANNTAYAAGAMLRLFKETGKQKYLDLSYVCLAGVFNNMQLWECDYGYARNFPTFFGVFPLKDAPYTAAYEEQEVFAALHDYLKEAEGIDIKPAVRLLIAEFIRHMLGRVVYYYPPMLPQEMLVTEPKTGEIDPKLWIALEDLHDGWEQCGEVGQEVYGAGIAFGVIPRQYFKSPGEEFILFCDYPLTKLKMGRKNIKLKTGGDGRLNCRVILLLNQQGNYSFSVTTGKKPEQEIEPVKISRELVEYNLCGNQEVTISWKKN